MPVSLEARLRSASRAQFVGREKELSALREALEAWEWPFHLLYVYGPGGIGKTSLLKAYEELCSEMRVPSYYLDTRDVDPIPEAFVSALESCCKCGGKAPLAEVLAAREARQVLLIDTFDSVAVLEGWLRERFLPGLPDNILVVLAARDAPARKWRAHPGWQALMEVLPLRNLNVSGRRELLQRRGVPSDQHEAVLSFTHGHPLAMSLVADLLDQQPGLKFSPDDAPDVVRSILEQVVQTVPGPSHRAALEACALVRYMTEGLLKTMLDAPDVFELFAWLRGLSLVDVGPRGIFVHDLVRDVLASDLRWRNPEWHAELHRRARQYYTDRLKTANADGVRHVLSDYTYLHRDHPLLRMLVTRLQEQWGESGEIVPERAAEGDWPVLIEMVRRHEGETSARVAAHWFERQPGGVCVFRNLAGDALGFELTLQLDKMSPADRAADPAVEPAWNYLSTQAPLREGERAVMFRYWMDREAYQDVSPVQSLVFLSQVQCYLNTPGLAFSFLPCRNPEQWELIFSFAGKLRLADADFELDGSSFAVFGHDWRTVPPLAWLDSLAKLPFGPVRESEGATEAESVVVLDEPSFSEAVREALRGLTRPETLYDNPLLYARIVVDRAGLKAGPAERIETLRTVLQKAAESVQAHPREARYYRALHRTYLDPAPTQEQAAELLDLPFSTYRRHLKKAIDCTVDVLWQQELGNL